MHCRIDSASMPLQELSRTTTSIRKNEAAKQLICVLWFGQCAQNWNGHVLFLFFHLKRDDGAHLGGTLGSWVELMLVEVNGVPENTEVVLQAMAKMLLALGKKSDAMVGDVATGLEMLLLFLSFP